VIVRPSFNLVLINRNHNKLLTCQKKYPPMLVGSPILGVPLVLVLSIFQGVGFNLALVFFLGSNMGNSVSVLVI
jgi:hypothetical protein